MTSTCWPRSKLLVLALEMLDNNEPVNMLKLRYNLMILKKNGDGESTFNFMKESTARRFVVDHDYDSWIKLRMKEMGV